MTIFYYICDGCGNLANVTGAALPEDETWTCDECGSVALWEFTDQRKALAHSEHIRRGVRSGLFRSAAFRKAARA